MLELVHVVDLGGEAHGGAVGGAVGAGVDAEEGDVGIGEDGGDVS